MSTLDQRPRPLGLDRVRTLTPTERQRLATDLRALADELDRPDAGRTQQALAAAIDAAYAATASGAAGPGGGGSTGDTVVEARAGRPDPTASAASLAALRLHRIRLDVDAAYVELTSWRGDRPVALCPEGHVLDRTPGGSKVCNWVDPDTGRRCGTQREIILHCENPFHLNHDGAPVKLLKGERRWKVVAIDLPDQPEISECAKCRSYRARNHRSWGSAIRLDDSALVTELGTYHSEEPWAQEVAG